MTGHRTPYRALLVGGFLLLGIYGCGWIYLLLRSGTGRLEEDGALAIGSDRQVYYVVTTAGGEEQVISAHSDDPGSVLLEASRRFGEISQVKRVSRRLAESLEKRRTSGKLVYWVGLLLLLPAAMVMTGVWLRRGALQVESLWDFIRDTLGADAKKAIQATGLGAGALKRALAVINRKGLARLEWDRHVDRIVDTRLSKHSIGVNFCARCNEPLNHRMLADLKSIPRCPSCMFQHDAVLLNKLIAPIVDELHREAAEGGLRSGEEKPFSLGTFALLALVFPPVAIVYAVQRSS